MSFSFPRDHPTSQNASEDSIDSRTWLSSLESNEADLRTLERSERYDEGRSLIRMIPKESGPNAELSDSLGMPDLSDDREILIGESDMENNVYCTICIACGLFLMTVLIVLLKKPKNLIFRHTTTGGRT